VAGTGKPLYLSTGVSTLADIEHALDAVGRKAVLLHCVTAYPAPEDEYNLALIPNLRAVLGVPVGLSDHSADPVLVPALAAALGACLIEKHITLSTATGGLDDPIAQEPPAFLRMAKAVRRAASAGREATFAELEPVYGAERLRVVLGTGVKALAPSERENYGRTNRSLHARRAISRGETFSPENLVIVRTERRLRPGVGPELYDRILGRPAVRDVPSGEGVTWEDF
jgi:N-acetylneuraminate synthase